jgi:hypothetical protein
MQIRDEVKLGKRLVEYVRKGLPVTEELHETILGLDARAARLHAQLQSAYSFADDVQEIAVYHLDVDHPARQLLMKAVKTFRLAAK